MNISQIEKLATAVAMSHEGGKRTKHVAFLLRGNKIISVGVNSNRSHPLAKRLKAPRFTESQCAELNVCLKIGLNHRDSLPDFSLLTMIVVRVRKCGKLGMSKPCIGCQHLIRQCGFKDVYYSNENGELVCA